MNEGEKPPERRRRLALSTVFFSIATGFSRVAGLVREIVAASYFGVSGAMSAHVKAERVAAGERRRLVTLFHLVPHEGLEAYRRQASSLQGLLRPLTVTVTGPWPAFAFGPELF